MTAPLGSLWLCDAPPGPHCPSLAGDHSTDVLVIGGGVAGLSTALHLAEAGVDVVLVEAGLPGGGATGQSGGVIVPDFVRHGPAAVDAAVGAAAGARMVRLVGESAQFCFDLVARHGIDCDARQDGFWSPSHTPALVEAQQAMAAEWRARGFDVDFVGAAETVAALGSGHYCGALRFAQGGSLNPLAFARGLAGAAIGAGARLFCQTPVSALARTEIGWRATTPQGSVTARRLVLAANGGNPDLHPALRRTILPLRVVEFATAPLTAAQRRQVLPQGGSFTDKNPYVFTARYDGAGRLISAFGRTLLDGSAAACRAEARRRLAQAFGGLDADISHIWKGTAWINTSFLPQIYALEGGALAIQACNGRGVSINTAIGRDVAQALAAGEPDRLALTPQQPVPVRLHAGATMLPRVAMTLARLADQRVIRSAAC
ncbi:NAD(P)/FAD-dependent oxidoreductase [Polymorphobacter fuscus]|uniref:FAD-dependent oxidoreductase n=1 Tax=Sandarakinorhabdus fusca TaxID=1439888 RepID=A0A7C9GSX8_9SPHN|nr:FAD-binding oxidoreductase [Polymorphobacter fuscus]KAB7648300.1 FAD-binding oxidoreductase [Polymorphobacter fuscus]MQT15809.1 FAD-dependent oxidoreductase [Polymorphobacter fuscus]NJC07918.1 glycine/D-amino acid oxidase-like deaminating enzyme [Polymorphobacter fuscus]